MFELCVVIKYKQSVAVVVVVVVVFSQKNAEIELSKTNIQNRLMKKTKIKRNYVFNAKDLPHRRFLFRS